MKEPVNFPPRDDGTESPFEGTQGDQEADALGEEEATSALQDRIIVALLENGTQEKAAAALGISPTTLWRQMQKPGFARALQKARRQAVSFAIARLQQASAAAVGTLLRLMTDREVPAAARIRAADIVLQASLKGVEIEDIEVRLDELEQAAGNSRLKS